MKVQSKTYAAIRFSDGRPWIDIGNSCGLLEEVHTRLAIEAKQIPQFTAGNPVLCIAEVTFNAEVPDTMLHAARKKAA